MMAGMGVAARTGLVRISLGRGLSVADVVRAMRDDVRPFALVGRWAGSRAVVGSAPVEVVEGAAVLDVLGAGRGGDGEPGVGGGWFGYLGFGLGAAIERLPPPPPRPMPLPSASLGFYDHVLRLDDAGEWWFEAVTRSGAGRLDELQERLSRGASERAWQLGGLEAGAGATARHTAAVEECVERIGAGELFQANVCLRLEGRFRGSAADAFLAAAERLEPAYGAYVQLDDDTAVLSFSPELFLRREGDRVTTSPIKGTAPRDAGPDALTDSAKDAAEHVMIVDLSRNDLGRVARYGSVEAHERRVEPHPGLWHLVSDVTARTRPGTTDADLVRAAFPPGSVTGAPKIQALKVIADLEGTQREVYTGAIGYSSPHAGLELNVAIRTLEISGDHAWMGCGGGIVADSQPHPELDEALNKARPIAQALGADVPAPAREERPRRPRLKAWVRRPDPTKGLIETIAVRNGEAVDAESHLDRLAASVEAVYGVELPRPAIEPAARDGVIRVTFRPGAGVEVEPGLQRPPKPVILEPRALAGGLGAHKWLDRPHEPHHLAVDLDGSVLEAGFANVWILGDDGKTLLTPPADGRILPGITRERLLAAPDIPTREQHLTLEDLNTANTILLTSSIRLVTPAALYPREPLEFDCRLAARLRDLPAISNKTDSYIR